MMLRLQGLETVFPTHVGMNRVNRDQRRILDSVPHARGDEPVDPGLCDHLAMCSPRTWG